MVLKLVLLILVLSSVSADSLSIQKFIIPEEPLTTVSTRLSRTNKQFKDMIKEIQKVIDVLNKTPSGRRPCIWKICSKPYKTTLNNPDSNQRKFWMTFISDKAYGKFSN